MLWLFFMVWVMLVGAPVLTVISVVVVIVFTQSTLQQFMRYVRRSRWLLLVLLLMHAYNLPGAPLLPFLGSYSPSQSGIYSGLLQTWRLLLMLAMLAVLMTRLSQESLLTGIYSVIAPLRQLGFAPERIAMRIWLTLRYAESLTSESQQMTFKQRLRQISCPPPLTGDMMQPLVLPVVQAGWLDYVCVMCMAILGLWVR